jgi:hypothetical protein
MALQYSNKSLRDFGGGIDQRSTPNNIPESFCEDIQNANTNSNGFISKRKGYQGYYGHLPLRVKSIIRDGTTSIKFVLDDSIDISSLPTCPIVVQGKLSGSQSGDWSDADNVEYYSASSTDVRTSLAASGSLVTVSESTHGVTSSEVFITLMDNSSDISSRDWTLFFADRAIVDSNTFDVDIEYSTLPSDITAFVGVSDKQTTSGADYTATDVSLIDTQTVTITEANPGVFTTGSAHGLAVNDPVKFTTAGTLPTNVVSGTTYYVKTVPLTTTLTIAATAGGTAIDTSGSVQAGVHTIAAGEIVITQATTGFTNNNILCQVFELDSGASEYYRIFPDISINNSNGTVTIDHTNSGAAPITVSTRLSQAAAANFKTVQVGTGAPGGTDVTTTISSITDDWYNVQVYENNAGTLTWVMPEDVTKDESADTLSIQVINSGANATYYIFWESIDLASATLVVTDNGGASATYTDAAPQLTLWGISHDGIYSTSGNQDGHVTHIDAYKKDTEERMVAGLGGNLYTARTRAEESTDFKIPTTNVDISGTLASDVSLAPCFDVTAATTNRTRGLLTSDEVVDNGALISAVEYVSSGVTKYTLTLTKDKLTVTGMANDAHNGTFTITAVDNSADTITVSNAAITLADFDETGAAGRAGIFTDQVTLSANSKFLPGDTFITNISSTEPTVSTTDSDSATTIVLAGITSAITLSNNLTVYGSRTGSVIPVDSTDDFVKGDMCTFGTLAQQVRVKNINVASDLTVSTITGDGTTATVTTSSAHGLISGQKVSILRSGVAGYDGEQPIEAITAPTTFTFTSTETTSASTGIVLGKTIEIDESTTIADNIAATALAVAGRWIPVEAPTTADGLPDTTYIKHLDASEYEAQDTVRSAMVADNMYFTNYSDEVMKFDGTSIYQAGIFRWQPQLFAQIDPTTSITANTTKATTTVDPDGLSKFTTATGEASQFIAGDVVAFSGNSNSIHTVNSVDTVNDLVYIVDTFTDTVFSGSETITLANRFAYYFRLNAIDANDNIIASAATGASDFTMDLGVTAAQIRMRLLGFPLWGNYDYDKLELEIYRTKSGTAAPFYRVGIKDIDFNAGAGYIDFQDTVNDNLLGARELDPVNTNLLGAEIGTAWSQPLRSKYITSADNRLILANVKDYPELDIVIRSDEGVGGVTAANMTGKILTLRKDKTDAGTTTNMTAVARYEFLTSATVTPVTITPNTDIIKTQASTDTSAKTFIDGDVNTGTENINITTHGYDEGQKIQLTTSGTLPAGLALATDYYVIKVDADNIKLATTRDLVVAGTAVNITAAAGGGTHTVTAETTTATFTIEKTTHGLSAGHWVYMYHAAAAGDNSLTYAGWWQINEAETNTFVIKANMNTASVAADVDTYVVATTKTDIPVWIGTDGNMNQVNGNGVVSGTITEFDAIIRMANAINASMRMVDTSLAATFSPWITANAGSEYNIGQLILRQPGVFSTTMECVLPLAITGSTYYVNNDLKAASAEVSATERILDSRVVVSYRNFPEIFNSPFGDATQTGVIDVNAADGQAITGIIPFFGEAVFGAGQVEEVIVVFKTNSIYLLNSTTGDLNKIQSRGLGCTAPYSIASTRDGIMFANNSGIYRLNRDQSISYVGKNMERLYRDGVNRDQLSKMYGHHYGITGQYKLSVPFGDSQATNNRVFVYDHQREEGIDGFGAWSQYTNHNTTGWANLNNDAFFATTNGQVFSVRRAGDSTDYRDDADAVDTMNITLAAQDFDNPGARKVINSVTSHFHVRNSSMIGTTMSSSVELDGDFTSAGTFTFTKSGNDKVKTARSSLPVRKSVYTQLKYINNTKDEDVVLSGVDFRVALLSDKGIQERSESS